MKKRKNAPLILAAIICAVSLVVMLFALSNPKQEQAAFAPPSFDSTAQAGTPTVPENLGWGELDAQAFKASVCGVVIPNGNTADVWFTNPESNTVWLKLRVLDENGNILGETGLIKPGEYVQSVTLDTVPKAGTTIALKLMSYQPETYYSEGAATLTTTVSEGGTP